MRKVTRVEVREGYALGLTFDDGARGVVDLSHLAGKGVFEFWLDRRAFEAVRIGPSGERSGKPGGRGGSTSGRPGDEVDLCPDALYLKATGKKAEDVFPAAHRETAHV